MKRKHVKLMAAVLAATLLVTGVMTGCGSKEPAGENSAVENTVGEDAAGEDAAGAQEDSGQCEQRAQVQ